MSHDPTIPSNPLLLTRANTFLKVVSTRKNFNTFKKWVSWKYKAYNHDLVQTYYDDTMQRCYNIIKSGKHRGEVNFTQDQNFTDYFFSFLYADYWRFVYNQNKELNENLYEEQPTFSEFEVNEMIDVVMASFNSLKPMYREVLSLHYFEKMKYKDIAEKLGLPLGTVKDRIHFAKAIIFRECESDIKRIKEGD